MKLNKLSATRRLRLAALLLTLLCFGAALPLQSAVPLLEDWPLARAAEHILQHQASDGAIVMGTLPAKHSRLVPYCGNFAGMGLVAAYRETGDARYLDAVKRWLVWYEAHMNPDGTIYDFLGTPGDWKSGGDYDSTDSYAATYLDLVLAVHQAAPDSEWLRARLPAVRQAVAAIRLTMQPNGLTTAKPKYPIMYLMDNTETSLGLRATAAIASELGDAALEQEARVMGARMEQAITRDLWDEARQVYRVGLQKNGATLRESERWYPLVMANLMAIGWLPPSARHRTLLAQFKEKYRTEMPTTVAQEGDLDRLVWWAIAAQSVGDRRLQKEVAAKLVGFDAHLKKFANPGLLGHLCRILAQDQTKRATPITELRDHYDIVIAGAGTGGFGAAMQAARLGVSVLVLEETDWIGGQMNAAAVTSMDEGPKHQDRPYILVRERGLYREFTDEITAHYQQRGITAETAYWNGHICMEPRVGQDILYRMLDTARGQTEALHVSLRSKVTQVLKNGNTVTGVNVDIVTPQGTATRSIQSGVLVDATEWGDVIPLTGARYRVGNCINGAVDPNREIQSETWTAVIKQYPKGVPPELLITKSPPGYDTAHQRFLKSLVAGAKVETQRKPWNFATFIGYRGMPNSEQPDAVGITRTHMNYNNDYPVRIRDVEDAAARLATCREAELKTLQLLYYIQHTLGKTDWSVANDEGYDSPFNRAQVDQWIKEQPELEPYRPILYHFPVMPYARESRRIMGLHTLIASEIERRPRSPKMFENTVALGDYPVDLHGSKKPELLELDLDQLQDIPRKSFGERGIGPFAIPFECFIPEKLDGFIAAEKNISQSRLANGATRLQPSTMLMGQAAGAIAALSVKHGVKPRELDPVLVQRVLLAAGDTLQITPLKDVAKTGWEWPAIQLVTVRGLMALQDSYFFPDAPLTGEALALLMKHLFNADASVPNPITRAAFAKLLQPAMATSGVKLEAADKLKEPANPITRLEAAQVVAAFLEQRAVARLRRQEQTLPWPASQAATPLTREDLAPPAPSLATDLRALIEHGVIDSADYWITHAVKGAMCDGKHVATLLKKTAKTIKPTSDEAQVFEVCMSAGFINTVAYWKTNAVEGGQCSGVHVASVIRHIAQRLVSMKQPASSTAKPEAAKK